MTFHTLAPTNEEKRIAFGPVLHLDHQERVLLDQFKHFDEIYIYLKNASGSAEDVVEELEKKQEAYEEEKMKEQIEEEMRSKFEEIDTEENKEETNEASLKDL